MNLSVFAGSAQFIGAQLIGASTPALVIWLTTFIATVFASSWGPVGIMSIWSRRITEAAAFWGMLSGLVFNVVPKFFEFVGLVDLPAYLEPAIIGGVASLVVTILVSRRTEVSAEEAGYLANLHVRPADEAEAWWRLHMPHAEATRPENTPSRAMS